MDWHQLLNPNRRQQSTNPGGDDRQEFERDFDRSIFSTPVKRLQDKAQVFPLEPHDAVRTRLTHSLEVSSVARGLARAVTKWLVEDKKEMLVEQGRSVEAIAATAALIHDLGNPPFGHSGELAIGEWFKESFKSEIPQDLRGNEQLTRDFMDFEGNAQTLRLVTKLQILAHFHGLNLTFGTLSAAIKYIAPSHQTKDDEDDHASSKPGYFASESEVVERIRQETGTGVARNPITYLVEAADDMVYSVADVEDAVKKGVMSWDWAKSFLIDKAPRALAKAIEGMENILRAGGTEVPKGLEDDAYASAFRTAVISVVFRSVIAEFKKRYDAIMGGTYKSALVADCDARELVDVLKVLGRTKVYCTQSNLKLELMGRRVIQDLMDIFWEGAQVLPIEGNPKPKGFTGKIGLLLSENYRRVFRNEIQQSPLPELYHRYQLVTDYVCGMTDSFAKRLHSELTNG